MTPPTNRFYLRTLNEPPHPVGTPNRSPAIQFPLRTPSAPLIGELSAQLTEGLSCL